MEQGLQRAGMPTTARVSATQLAPFTLPLLQLKRLEGVGLPREQAEALTRFLATTLCTNHEKMEELYVAKVTLEKVRHDPASAVLRRQPWRRSAC
jgi:hypothetical protein